MTAASVRPGRTGDGNRRYAALSVTGSEGRLELVTVQPGLAGRSVTGSQGEGGRR